MVEIERYKGYKVEYNALKHRFEAWKWNEKAGKYLFVGAKVTQEELEDFIDRRFKRDFRRIPALIPAYHTVEEVTVTSFDKERDGMIVWVVDEQGGASKHKIRRIFQRTTENIKLLREIQKRAKQIDQLEKEIEDLQQKFTDPVTEENIEVLAGFRKE